MKTITYFALFALAPFLVATQISHAATPLAAIGYTGLSIKRTTDQKPAARDATFTDVTQQSGIVQNNASWGAAWADYDDDGFIDVMTVGHLQHPNLSIDQLWHNNGDGTFTDVTVQAGLIHEDGDCHGAAWGDFDNDGRPDLFVSKGTITEIEVNYDDLWYNNGDGTFTNIAASSHVTGQAPCDAAGAYAGGQVSALDGVVPPAQLFKRDNRGCYAIDYDGDSNLDIFVTSFYQGDLCRDSNLLFQNRRRLRFKNVAGIAGLSRPLTENRMSAWADFDGDGLLDVFIARPSALYKNLGDRTFADVTAAAGIISSSNVEDAAWGDYDNDGDMDVYLAMGSQDGSSVEGILYQNNADGTFTDVTAQSGVINISASTIGANWADYDNDGNMDLYLVNSTNHPNRLFHNNGDGTFTDEAAAAGVEAKTPEGNGSDASFIDYDNDGFVDLFVCNGAGVSYGPYLLFRNNGNRNGWLKVTLSGRRSNSSAIGAKVFLTTGATTQMREYTGQHYLSQNHIPVHFGVGAARIVDSLTIRWPSGTTQVLNNVAVDQTIDVVEQ